MRKSKKIETLNAYVLEIKIRDNIDYELLDYDKSLIEAISYGIQKYNQQLTINNYRDLEVRVLGAATLDYEELDYLINGNFGNFSERECDVLDEIYWTNDIEQVIKIHDFA